MDPQIKAALNAIPAQCRKRTIVSGVGVFLVCGMIWSFALCGVLLSPIWLSLIAAFGTGLSAGTLFIIAHDACHGSLTPSRRLNRLIGTMAFLPSYHPFSSWAKTHNGMHHVWTNLKGEDPVYAPYSQEEFIRLPAMKRLLERCYRSSLGLGLLYFIEVWCKFEYFPRRDHAPANRREFLMDRSLVLCFLIAQCVGYYWVSIATQRSYPILFAAYAIVAPHCVFLWLMGFVTYQHHTHPEIPWFDRNEEWTFFQSQVAGTTHVQFPRIVEIVVLNIVDHTAHHIDPLIPLYHLHESQLALESAFPGTMKIVRWTPRVFWKTLCCCKLYDYREHRWLDFNGTPTTPRLISVNVLSDSVMNVSGDEVRS